MPLVHPILEGYRANKNTGLQPKAIKFRRKRNHAYVLSEFNNLRRNKRLKFQTKNLFEKCKKDLLKCGAQC